MPAARDTSTPSITAAAGSRRSTSASSRRRSGAALSIRAGIGFNLTRSGADRDADAGQERIAAYYEQFQQHVAGDWKQLLTDWMAAHAGFIQHADRQPATDLMPADAVEWLANNRNAVEQGWVFVGAWLFADHPGDAETMEDPARLLDWMEATFTDLLPLWTSLYRESNR